MYAETVSHKASKIVCKTERKTNYTVTRVTVTDIEGNEIQHNIFHDDYMYVKVESLDVSK